MEINCAKVFLIFLNCNYNINLALDYQDFDTKNDIFTFNKETIKIEN